VFRQLEPQVGFPWTVRIMAFVALFAFLPSYAMLPLKPSKSPEVLRFIDPTAFKDVPFILFVLAGFFGAVGYYIPLIYLPIYAETAAKFTNTSLAFYLLAIINGTSTVGRIVAGTIAVSVGPVTTIALGIGCCGILLFSWTAVHTVAGLIVWSVIWGLVSSVIVSLPGAIIPILSPSMGVLGTRNGMYWAGSAVGVLIGSPIAGTLVVPSSSGVVWWRLQVFAGLSMVVGTVLVIYPAIYAARRRRS